nr:hypothetical protein [Tanacetum cinerariifolium]
MDEPNITIEEYIQLETEKALRKCKVYNWETATYGNIRYDEDVNFLRSVETKIPAISYNDTLTSKLELSCEPTVFNVDDLKLDMGNGDDKIDIKQSSGDLSIEPLPNVINIDIGAYAKWSNKLLETSHDTSINIEHIVKFSEKERILKHKRRVQESLLILTTYMAYHSRSIRRLPTDVYSLVNHHRVVKDLWERVQLLMQVNQQTHLAKFPKIDSGLAVLMLKHGDEPIDAINKMMSFLSTVVSSRFRVTNNQLRNSSNLRQQATIHDSRVTVQPVQGRQSSFAAGTSGTRDNISGISGNN